MELTEYTVEEESEVPSSKDVTGLEEGNNEFPETKATLAVATCDIKPSASLSLSLKSSEQMKNAKFYQNAKYFLKYRNQN